MKLESPYLRSRAGRGKALFVAIAVAAALTVAGFAAYRWLFVRPGEAAVMLLPADADFVISLDTNPSERQAPTFLRIADALEREGIAKRLDEALTDFLDGKPVGAEIRPRLSRSFALGVWSREGHEEEMVTLLAVKDVDSVRESLQRHGRARSGGVVSLESGGDSLFAATVADYLAISNSEAALARIEEVRSGRQPSVGRLPEFLEAIMTLPEDANVMVFLSPRAFELIERSSGEAARGLREGTKWLALGLTIEPEGLAVDFHWPMDAAKADWLKPLATARPLRQEVLTSLPDGALGVFACSEVGKVWEAITSAASEERDARQAFEEAVSEFERETGLSVRRDVATAFGGEQVFAMYPGPTSGAMDLDGMVYLTDANGADPGELAHKLRSLVETKSAEAGETVRFLESKIGDVTVWELDSKARQALFQGLASELSPSVSELGVRPTGGTLSRVESLSEGNGSKKQPRPLSEKTLMYAQIGRGVLLTSSRALLNRAIAGRTTGETLANDTAFANMWGHVVPGAQGVFMVDLSRVLECLRSVLDSGLEEAPFSTDDVIRVFGDSASGLVASGRYDGRVAVGRWMIPLHFERLIQIVGRSLRS